MLARMQSENPSTTTRRLEQVCGARCRLDRVRGCTLFGAAHRGVQSLPIVILLDELFDVHSQMFQVEVSASVNLLPLQGLDKAFAARVVVRVGRFRDGPIFSTGGAHESVA